MRSRYYLFAAYIVFISITGATLVFETIATSQSTNTDERVKHIETAQQFAQAIASPFCVVKFFGTWCPPCQRTAPLFKEVAQKHGKSTIRFIEVDIDNPELSTIIATKVAQGVPLFTIYKNGKELGEHLGAFADAQSLEAFVVEHLNKP